MGNPACYYPFPRQLIDCSVMIITRSDCSLHTVTSLCADPPSRKSDCQ